MSSDDLFIGNIKKCTQYVGEKLQANGNLYFDGFEIASEVYKENAILYKTKSGRYVDIENINSILDSLKIMRLDAIQKFGFIMPTIAYEEGCLYVDKSTIKPFYLETRNDISIKKLKQELNKH